VRSLREQPGRDVLVLNSASVIQELLRLDLLDDLWQAIVPSIVGGGLRLLPDGLPPSRWTLAAAATVSHGAVVVHHQREREASSARRAAARRSRAAS
jgi:dihydrofolate reductase